VSRLCLRPAVFVVIQGVTVIEEGESPAISAHGHEAMIDLVPGLHGALRHNASADRYVLQHLVDLAGEERGGCVQIILRSSHLLARTFYVWISVYNLCVVSVAWSLMADVFDRAHPSVAYKSDGCSAL